jgi:hypothetical protein
LNIPNMNNTYNLLSWHLLCRSILRLILPVILIVSVVPPISILSCCWSSLVGIVSSIFSLIANFLGWILISRTSRLSHHWVALLLKNHKMESEFKLALFVNRFLIFLSIIFKQPIFALFLKIFKILSLFYFWLQNDF